MLFQNNNSEEIESLDFYNTKPNEPSSSVMKSLDYEFATQKYKEDDFRYIFTNQYIEYVFKNLGIKLYNCKFSRPMPDSNFLNFYIYYFDELQTKEYRLEDMNDLMILAFYEVLENNKLPGITPTTRIQFMQKSIKSIMLAHIVVLACKDIEKNIKTVFPQVASVSFWESTPYIFIAEESFNTLIENTKYLHSLKEYCYNHVKKYDKYNHLRFEEFHIRVEDYGRYSSIGGFFYYRSDYMTDCLLV